MKNIGHIQITVPAHGRAYAYSLVCQLDVKGIPVRLRINGHGPDIHFAAGPDDPDRYLASVGNKDLLKHLAPR